jgi:hypothetical protein
MSVSIPGNLHLELSSKGEERISRTPTGNFLNMQVKAITTTRHVHGVGLEPFLTSLNMCSFWIIGSAFGSAFRCPSDSGFFQDASPYGVKRGRQTCGMPFILCNCARMCQIIKPADCSLHKFQKNVFLNLEKHFYEYCEAPREVTVSQTSCARRKI